ncbi:hypothetical protein BJV78DRAFT_1195321 [Lactifluus subvellereus]|nr:hypothetical protein BJV78DRAFT_1195321 [Lactifluus subvellereus]
MSSVEGIDADPSWTRDVQMEFPGGCKRVMSRGGRLTRDDGAGSYIPAVMRQGTLL